MLFHEILFKIRSCADEFSILSTKTTKSKLLYEIGIQLSILKFEFEQLDYDKSKKLIERLSILLNLLDENDDLVIFTKDVLNNVNRYMDKPKITVQEKFNKLFNCN